MKKIISLFSIFLTLHCFAQTATKTPSKAKLSEKDIMMCAKEWHIVSLESWGVVSKPDDKTKNDMLKLMQDGTFNAVLYGNAKSGTWTKAGQYISFVVDSTKEKFNYKVLTIESTKLKVDYLDPDEMHTIFEFQ